jgi:NitT/TauT family transport system permease protein
MRTELPDRAWDDRTEADRAAERITGLDALELGPATGKDALGLRIWRSAWPKLLAVALVVLAWQAVVWAEWKPVYVLPGPATVLAELGGLITTADFWDGVAMTMVRAVTGFGLAVLIGTIIGAAVSRFAPLRAAIGSLITGLQTMPSIMWFPLAILLFQLSESAILFVVVIGAAPSVANGLISGIDYVPRTWLRVGQVLGMTGFAKYRHLILPASLPSFISGLKQGWAFSWRSLMAGELLVIVPGGALHRRTHAAGPRPQRGQPGHLVHHRGAGRRHPDRRTLQRRRQRPAPPLGPHRQLIRAAGPT